MRPNKAVMQAGSGLLSFSGFNGPVDYQISARAVVTRAVSAGAAGAVELPPEVARNSFRAGAATLKLDDGRSCRIMMVGHSEGTGAVYFQTLA